MLNVHVQTLLWEFSKGNGGPEWQMDASPNCFMPFLLHSPSIGHEYYDPVEFMEGGAPETERAEELEYEVRM